jgi:antitoxin component of MazEF toxin-antitoxin module
MVKTLTRHGNSLALVIDKPILEMLHLDESTPLSITTTGDCMVVAPVKDLKRRQKFEAAKADTFKKYRKTLKRLAE